MCWKNASAPAATPPPSIVQPDDPSIQAAQDRMRKRLAVMRAGGTTKTSGQGVVAPPVVGQKNLLGE
jgi:hypothetical protein